MSEEANWSESGKIVLKSPNEVEWKIQNFFPIPKEKKLGYTSSTFSMLGEGWYFWCMVNHNVVLLCLNRKPRESKLGIQYCLGIECKGKMQVATVGEMCLDECEKHAAKLCIESNNLMAGEILFSAQSEITFFCCLEDRPAEETESSTTEGTYKLAQSFKNLLLSGDHHDTILKVKDQEFLTHKLVLVVRSVVFESMFRHDTAERQTGVITIEDCDPEAFREFLSFLYSAQLENVCVGNVMDIYYIADKYQVDEVKFKCLNFMLNNLSVDNFCDFICLALKHSETELLESATEYFVKNAKKICVTVKWLNFVKEYPVESTELNIKAYMHVYPD